MKVLLVDDDADLLDLTTYALRRDGYTVIAELDGERAVRHWESDQPDIIVLDVNLPRLSGFEVCRRIRAKSDTPIIMLTARDDEEDILGGFAAGADDYVCKPFSTKQLVVRMRAVLRRSQSASYREPTRTLTVGDFTLDVETHQAREKSGRVVQLTPLEFRIIHLLALNDGRTVPYIRLVEYAWGYNGGDSSLVKSHVCHLRTKLNLNEGGSAMIRTVSRLGYSLTRNEPAVADQ
jgi:DNA-binding response OmpR family regulator